MERESDNSPESPVTSDSGEISRPRDTWRKKAEIEDVFGADLPEVTSDECDQGHMGVSRDWYEANRPPHYE
ncbi:hypothetical protein [Gordonia sp. DT101]|uniref:hypothetical protein n=1 Tax=Gordonia sp. DT101 TaxID=3416545 RepID=UPI003CEB4147